MKDYLPNKKKYTVKDWISVSLLELLNEKTIDEISITEVCDKANVSRISFYRNFKELNDPIKYYLKEDIDEWWNSTFKNNNDEEIHQLFLNELFKHYLEKKDIMMILKSNNLLLLLKDVIYLSGGPMEEMNDDDAYTRAALFGAIYGLLEEWIKRDMNKIPSVKHISWINYEKNN